MYGVTFGSKEAAILSYLGLWGVLGLGGAAYAGWNRSWIARGLFLPVCAASGWAAVVVGGGKWFDTWQSMPNPPDEAFHDTGMFGALLLGWVPATLAVGFVFAFSALFTYAFDERRRDELARRAGGRA